MAVPKKTKTRAVEASDRPVVDRLRDAYGPEVIQVLGEAPTRTYDVISTGSYLVDTALGIGGLPRGRIVELYGPESSGKTTLCLHTVAQAQALGHRAGLVDAEHAFDPTYAEAIGVKPDNLVLCQPDYGEQGLEVATQLVSSGEFGIVVVDSVAALTPKAEIEGEMGDQHVGVQARMIGQAMRKITARANRTGTLVLFVNQLRHKIGVMFGSPETTPGGNALKFYASVRLDVRRIGTVKADGTAVANNVRVKVVKNKCAPPFREAEIDLLYGKGIDWAGELVDAGVAAGVVAKAGSWFSCDDKRIGQGRAASAAAIRNDSTLAERIRSALV